MYCKRYLNKEGEVRSMKKKIIIAVITIVIILLAIAVISILAQTPMPIS